MIFNPPKRLVYGDLLTAINSSSINPSFIHIINSHWLHIHIQSLKRILHHIHHLAPSQRATISMLLYGSDPNSDRMLSTRTQMSGTHLRAHSPAMLHAPPYIIHISVNSPPCGVYYVYNTQHGCGARFSALAEVQRTAGERVNARLELHSLCVVCVDRAL